jgi:hypothetical protein
MRQPIPQMRRQLRNRGNPLPSRHDGTSIMENRMLGEGKIVIHCLAALKSTRIFPFLPGVMDFRIPALQKLLARSGHAKLIARAQAAAVLATQQPPKPDSPRKPESKSP